MQSESSVSKSAPREQRAAVKPLRYGFDRSQTGRLTVEPRRALAIFRALDLVRDVASTRQLLEQAGRLGRAKEELPVITTADCVALARLLGSLGYPLTDDGVRAFRSERGFGAEIQIGPDVARAYARMVVGGGARAAVTREHYTEAGIAERRALKLLLFMSHREKILEQTLVALGCASALTKGEGEIEITLLHARRLIDWLISDGLSLDGNAFASLCRELGMRRPTVEPRLARFVAERVTGRGEPKPDYAQVTSGEVTLNGRTLAMLRNTERLLDGTLKLNIVRGSYVSGTGRGAHPHMQGGVVDIATEGMEREGVEQLVAALRQCGFAAWARDRDGSQHVHAVAVGDEELAPSARWQVRAYFQGRDGRSRSDIDPHWRLAVALPEWVLAKRADYI